MIYRTPRKLSRISHESPAGIEEELSCAKQPASCAVKPCVQNMLTIMIIGLLQIYGIFRVFIFMIYADHKNIFTTKISRSTVVTMDIV